MKFSRYKRVASVGGKALSRSPSVYKMSVNWNHRECTIADARTRSTVRWQWERRVELFLLWSTRATVTTISYLVQSSCQESEHYETQAEICTQIRTSGVVIIPHLV